MVCYLLRELGVQLPEASYILTDNKSTLFMVRNLVVHAPTHHIEIDYHYVGEFIATRKRKAHDPAYFITHAGSGHIDQFVTIGFVSAASLSSQSPHHPSFEIDER